MPDMLVKLYALPEIPDLQGILQSNSILIRRALVPEKAIIVDWVESNFNRAWASECDVTFSNKPVSCFVAVKNESLIGFACYDSIFKNFFGPMGVLENHRGLGAGKGLLLSSLHSMREQGYAYAIIGGVGPSDFYKRTVGATIIDGSDPGIYQGVLKDL